MTTIPNVDELLDVLQKHIWMGRTHLWMWRQVNDYLALHQDVMNVSHAFFSFTLRSHLDSAFLHLARLVDQHREAISVDYLLRVAETHSAKFAHASSAEITKSVKDDRSTLARLAKSIDAVVVRRDKQLAHLDKETLTKPASIEADATITYKDADDLFVALSAIVNRYSGFWRNSLTMPELAGWEDFNRLAIVAEDGLRMQDAEHAKEAAEATRLLENAQGHERKP